MDGKKKAAEVLVAKTNFAPAAAERFVSELNDADVSTIVELGEIQFAKAPINAFLDVIAARKQSKAAETSPDEAVRASAGKFLDDATKEFREGLRAVKQLEREGKAAAAAREAAPPASPAGDPVSQETKKKK